MNRRQMIKAMAAAPLVGMVKEQSVSTGEWKAYKLSDPMNITRADIKRLAIAMERNFGEAYRNEANRAQ